MPQKRKLQVNVTDELRWKNTQQNPSKHIPKNIKNVIYHKQVAFIAVMQDCFK